MRLVLLFIVVGCVLRLSVFFILLLLFNIHHCKLFGNKKENLGFLTSIRILVAWERCCIDTHIVNSTDFKFAKIIGGSIETA